MTPLEMFTAGIDGFQRDIEAVRMPGRARDVYLSKSDWEPSEPVVTLMDCETTLSEGFFSLTIPEMSRLMRWAIDMGIPIADPVDSTPRDFNLERGGECE